MSKSKEEKNGKTPKYKLKSICIFGEADIKKGREFLTVASELGNALVTRKIDFVYGGSIKGLKGSVVIFTSIKVSKVLSVCVKELDGHIFSIRYELQVSSLSNL